MYSATFHLEPFKVSWVYPPLPTLNLTELARVSPVPVVSVFLLLFPRISMVGSCRGQPFPPRISIVGSG